MTALLSVPLSEYAAWREENPFEPTMTLGAAANVAVTDAALLMVNEQVVAAWVQLPLQPPNVDTLSGEAYRLTTVPAGRLIDGQSLPETQETPPLTEPPPVPVIVRVRGN